MVGLRDQFGGAYHGTEPTASAIAPGERTLEAVRGMPFHEAGVLGGLATLHAWRGEFAVARELALRGRSMFEDIGASLFVSYITIESIGRHCRRPLGTSLSACWRRGATTRVMSSSLSVPTTPRAVT